VARHSPVPAEVIERACSSPELVVKVAGQDKQAWPFAGKSPT